MLSVIWYIYIKVFVIKKKKEEKKKRFINYVLSFYVSSAKNFPRHVWLSPLSLFLIEDVASWAFIFIIIIIIILYMGILLLGMLSFSFSFNKTEKKLYFFFFFNFSWSIRTLTGIKGINYFFFFLKNLNACWVMAFF